VSFNPFAERPTYQPTSTICLPKNIREKLTFAPMIENTPIEEIKAHLQNQPRVVITMHRGPDGDAIGSSLGLYHILKGAGIEAAVIAPDAYPTFLAWMPGNETVMIFESQQKLVKEAVAAADFIFCLDFNASNRLGDLEETIISAGKPICVIDHHEESEPFASQYFADPTACSTAEMIVRFADAIGFDAHIGQDAAYCLYTGLVTDTGSFRYASVTPAVLRMAARLMETGIDHSNIYTEIFNSNSESQIRLHGYALSQKLVVIPNTGVAYISLTEKELHQHHFRKGDTEGLVNEALSIKGVHVAGFFAEKDGLIKISLRSLGHFDVNELARQNFEGGGHRNAAGGRYRGAMADVLEKFEQLARTHAAEIRGTH